MKLINDWYVSTVSTDSSVYQLTINEWETLVCCVLMAYYGERIGVLQKGVKFNTTSTIRKSNTERYFLSDMDYVWLIYEILRYVYLRFYTQSGCRITVSPANDNFLAFAFRIRRAISFHQTLLNIGNMDMMALSRFY